MPGTTVLVKAGPSAQINGPLDAGAVLYNGDHANAIWFSSVPTVSPGNGTLLAPYSSATWRQDKKQVYACVDSGVTSSVAVQVTDDVSEVNNIAGVAAATALALLAQGIPNVLVADDLLNSTISGAGNFLNVTQYSSLYISMSSDPFATLVVGIASIGPGGEIMDNTVLTSPTGFINVQLPVIGNSIRITTLHPIDIVVIGSNRTVTTKRLLSSDYTRSLVASGTFVIGTRYNFVASDGNPNETQFNGSVTYSFSTGGSTAGVLVGTYLDTTGASQTYNIIIPVGVSAVNFAHPFAGVTWQFQCSAGSGASFCILTIASNNVGS